MAQVQDFSWPSWDASGCCCGNQHKRQMYLLQYIVTIQSRFFCLLNALIIATNWVLVLKGTVSLNLWKSLNYKYVLVQSLYNFIQLSKFPFSWCHQSEFKKSSEFHFLNIYLFGNVNFQGSSPLLATSSTRFSTPCLLSAAHKG